jgi:predicted nucleic-acid-binding protein
MIGLDTNVLVRYVAQDDSLQSPIAAEFIETVCSEKHPGFINHIVLCETVWVLDRCYHTDKDTIVVGGGAKMLHYGGLKMLMRREQMPAA